MLGWLTVQGHLLCDMPLKSAAESVLYRMVIDKEYASSLCIMLQRLSTWTDTGSMYRADLAILQHTRAVFAEAPILLALIYETENSIMVQLRECVKKIQSNTVWVGETTKTQMRYIMARIRTNHRRVLTVNGPLSGLANLFAEVSSPTSASQRTPNVGLVAATTFLVLSTRFTASYALDEVTSVAPTMPVMTALPPRLNMVLDDLTGGLQCPQGGGEKS